MSVDQKGNGRHCLVAGWDEPRLRLRVKRGQRRMGV